MNAPMVVMTIAIMILNNNNDNVLVEERVTTSVWPCLWVGLGHFLTQPYMIEKYTLLQNVDLSNLELDTHFYQHLYNLIYN